MTLVWSTHDTRMAHDTVSQNTGSLTHDGRMRKCIHMRQVTFMYAVI